MLVADNLVLNGGFAKRFAPIRCIIVADEKSGFGRKVEDTPDAAIKVTGIPLENLPCSNRCRASSACRERKPHRRPRRLSTPSCDRVRRNGHRDVADHEGLTVRE